MTRLVGLAPVIGSDTRLLVLGSFPGVASLREQRYYGHPQNQFWRILSALWSLDLVAMDYPARLDMVRARGLGIWDVYAACEREGSLDTNIRNAKVNDFAALQKQLPKLAAIAHNGGESFRHVKAVRASLGLQGDGKGDGEGDGNGNIASLRLPSTSPANASWSFEKKLNAWAEALAPYGLV